MDDLLDSELYPYAEDTEKILGCIFDVYHYFGPGFLESVYHKCLEIELTKAGIPFESEKKLKIFYKGEDIGMRFFSRYCCGQQNHSRTQSKRPAEKRR